MQVLCPSAKGWWGANTSSPSEMCARLDEGIGEDGWTCLERSNAHWLSRGSPCVLAPHLQGELS